LVLATQEVGWWQDQIDSGSLGNQFRIAGIRRTFIERD
jgi:hypothetical protein